MDFLGNLALGFSVVLSGYSLLYCLFGVTVGMLIGVLPGIGAMAAISMLLPVTFYLQPEQALIMLAGIYYGAQYGGSIASILLNVPGTPSSALICLDGYPLARQGRAGAAIFITTIASFFGSCFAILCLAAFSPPIARVRPQFRIRRILRPHGFRPDYRIDGCPRVSAEEPCDGGPRPGFRTGRNRCHQRDAALYLRPAEPGGRAQHRRHCDGRFRHGRNHRQLVAPRRNCADRQLASACETCCRPARSSRKRRNR